MNAERIIDAHCHIFPDKVAQKATDAIGAYYDISMYADGTVAGLLENGGRIGVEKYIVHSTATKVDQVMTINDFIAGKVAANDSFIGFGTMHPGVENIDSEIDRMISLGLKGIKLHPEFQDFNLDDEDMMPLYRAAAGRLPILIHTGDEQKTSSSPKRLTRILDAFPHLVVIAAHLGGYHMWDEAEECLISRNVYFDTSSSLFMLDSERAAAIIRRHGVDKVLFGTDYPMWSHEEEFERFNRLGLTQEERRLILYENAAKLLKI